MPGYDRQHTPPAPVADVTIVHPVTELRSGLLRGKLDTGAGLSIIPRRIVDELALSPHGQIWARSYDGTYSRRQVYYARLLLDEHELQMIQCLAIDRETVLIGRNVINRFTLILNGPRLHFDLKR